MQNTLILGGGCFWGLEELFRKQPGVLDTEVGYAGGMTPNPTYESHEGHAEVVRIVFDPTRTSYKQLLAYFFTVHDPTTKNRQGNDIGTSYRSIIFYANEAEKRDAEDMIAMVENAGIYTDPVVTQVVPFREFFSAEEYHQKYLQKHPGGYTCHFERVDVETLLS